MALQFNTYVDPGVYIGEVIVPGAVNIATTPVQVGIIGPGDRTKQVSSEAVQRGLVAGESLTWSVLSGSIASITAPVSGVQTLTDSTGAFTAASIGQPITVRSATAASNNGTFTILDRLSATQVTYYNPGGVVQAGAAGTYAVQPHAVFAARTDRALQNTTVYRNGIIVSDNHLAYQSAYVQGDVTANRDFSSPDNSMVLALDGRDPITLRFLTAGGIAGPYVSPATAASFAVSGSVVTLTDPSANFAPSIVGQTVTVAGASNPANNGSYVITARPSAISISYTNGSGVAQAFGGGTTYTIPYSMARRVGSGTTYNLITSAALLTAVSIDEVAEGVNVTLEVASNYGSAYASAARSGTAGLRIVSPLTSPASDVQVLAPILGGTTTVTGDLNAAAGSQLFTTWVAADGVKAVTVLGMSRLVYAAAATYTVDYIDIDLYADTLLNTGVLTLSKVGSFAGIGNFEENIDFVLTGDTVDWGGPGSPPDLPPYYPPVGVSGPTGSYSLADGTDDTLRLAFDGLDAVDIDIIQADPGAAHLRIAGFEYGLGSPTAAQVVQNINAVIADSTVYGPRYKDVAQVVNLGAGDFVQLTSPTEGEAGSVQILVPADSANTKVFGLSATQTVTVTGVGSRPASGSVYFASYAVTRPASDYNVQKRFFTLDNVKADLGPTTPDNPLVIACELAFANNAPSVVVVQVDDSTVPGTPTRQQWQNALNATIVTDVITDLILLTSDLAVQTDLKDHIEGQASPFEKHYRRGWFGMPRSTAIGDKDTADTYVYRARRTLQYAPDSPGRGRLILVGSPQLSGVSRDLTLEDGTTFTFECPDTTYLAVALAARKASLLSPAASLAKKTITGFNITDVTAPWLKAERGVLASQGVMVVTYDAGIFKILDPVTTEVGGGGLAAFSYESTSSQKDNVTRKVDQSLEANIVGIVPTDLSDFIVDIKLNIADVIEGEIGSTSIGPFRNTDGTPRAIDLTRDIVVQQSPNDPTKFFFKYWFNLRYPALRLAGEFSVDNPWFSSSG